MFYTEADMLEAIRLCKEEDYSISCASTHINEIKENVVPYMTLFDRLGKKNWRKRPALGRRQVPIYYFLSCVW
jgi:hypothetical protein